MYGYKVIRGSVSDWMSYEDETNQGAYIMPDGKPFLVYDSSITPREYILYVGNGVNTIAELLQSSPSPGGSVQDVQIDEISIVVNGVANIPKGSSSTLGVVSSDLSGGTAINSTGKLIIEPAGSTYIQQGTATRRPITVSNQHEATFYGLAKAAGDTTQASASTTTYPVGTYTDDAKEKIQNMLGFVTVTQTEYDSLTTKNPSTIYIITED
jgi:phosphopantothenoylcysteine synthetase/decarboxylase